jgi:hypothetical protein
MVMMAIDPLALAQMTNVGEPDLLQAISSLAPLIGEESVLETLCRMSVEKKGDDLRVTLLKILKPQSNAAGVFLAGFVFSESDPSIRKRALVNLCLLKCRDQLCAVMKGFDDAHEGVRRAAAYNAGLYSDPDFLMQVTDYFERRPFYLLWDLAVRIFYKITALSIRSGKKKMVRRSRVNILGDSDLLNPDLMS